MFTAFDHILIDVPDMASARKDFNTFLGPANADNTIELGNVNIRLQQTPGLTAPRIAGLALLDESLPAGAIEALDGGHREVPLYRANLRSSSYREDKPSETGVYGVDHVVLQSGDAQACIDLFRDQLGLRLALDQEVPEWGGRMLFFRLGKMTLEIIQNLKKPPATDFFWGVTYLCHDIDQTIASLDARDIAHSPIREGRKPGTRVSTVKSHNLGLPTLLIGQ